MQHSDFMLLSISADMKKRFLVWDGRYCGEHLGCAWWPHVGESYATAQASPFLQHYLRGASVVDSFRLCSDTMRV